MRPGDGQEPCHRSGQIFGNTSATVNIGEATGFGGYLAQNVLSQVAQVVTRPADSFIKFYSLNKDITEIIVFHAM